MLEEPLLICVAAHKCTVRPCYHAHPHPSNFGKRCGPAMTCSDAQILSYCVPVTACGAYQETVRTTCPHCKGSGRLECVKTHTYCDDSEKSVNHDEQ